MALSNSSFYCWHSYKILLVASLFINLYDSAVIASNRVKSYNLFNKNSDGYYLIDFLNDSNNYYIFGLSSRVPLFFANYSNSSLNY